MVVGIALLSNALTMIVPAPLVVVTIAAYVRFAVAPVEVTNVTTPEFDTLLPDTVNPVARVTAIRAYDPYVVSPVTAEPASPGSLSYRAIHRSVLPFQDKAVPTNTWFNRAVSAVLLKDIRTSY